MYSDTQLYKLNYFLMIKELESLAKLLIKLHREAF